MEVREDTDGDGKVAHVVPLVVSTIEATELTIPTATQVVELLQEILLSELRFAGGLCALHEEPLIVLRISVPPTAVHSVVETQEIDTGGKEGS
jgi:hypothetical protein